MSFTEKIYINLYEIAYFLGTIISRQLRSIIGYFTSNFSRFFNDTKNLIITNIKIFVINTKHEVTGKQKHILSYRKTASNYFTSYLNKDENNEIRISALKSALKYFLIYIWKLICIFFNYFSPIIATILLFVTLGYFENLKYGLAYIKDGKTLCYIDNESIFTQAEQLIRNRNLDEIDKIESYSPSFSVVPIDEEYLTNAENLANIILTNSGVPVYEGYGLYIDDILIGSTDEPDDLLLLLDEIREQYRGEGNDDIRLQFLQKIELLNGVFPTSTIKAISEFRNILNTEIEGKKYYTVELGDSPSLIASNYGISLSELYAMNPDMASNTLIVGQKVVVSNSVSYLNVTMTKRETYTEDVPYTTNYTYSNKYYTTYSKVTKAGVPGQQYVTALVTYENGSPVGRQVLYTEPISDPIPREVTVGTKSIIYSVGNSTGTSKGFRWPTDGGYVSCSFRGYKGHTGMDITGTGYGSNIYAAAAGTVVSVKWNISGYGRHLIINHGDGIQTLYAHCSNIYVVVGQYVNKGDIIAAMGSTGNSSGTHLHFEIRINGSYVDPAPYITK